MLTKSIKRQRVLWSALPLFVSGVCYAQDQPSIVSEQPPEVALRAVDLLGDSEMPHVEAPATCELRIEPYRKIPKSESVAPVGGLVPELLIGALHGAALRKYVELLPEVLTEQVQIDGILNSDLERIPLLPKPAYVPQASESVFTMGTRKAPQKPLQCHARVRFDAIRIEATTHRIMLQTRFTYSVGRDGVEKSYSASGKPIFLWYFVDRSNPAELQKINDIKNGFGGGFGTFLEKARVNLARSPN